MAKDKNTFIFHMDWMRAFRKLDGDSCKKLLESIADYALYGKEPEDLQGEASMAYIMLQPTIDYDRKAWQKTCDIRTKAGEKGGIAKASKLKQTEKSKSESSKTIESDGILANSSKTIQSDKILANSSKTWQTVAKPSKAWQSVANVADIEIEIDNDIEIEGDNPPKSPLTTPKTEKPAGEGESLSVEMATGAEQASPSKTLIRQRFDQFWAEYPRKAGKSDAAKAWKALNPDEALFAEIMDGLKRAKQSAQWLDNGGKYIPNPANWLSKRRWEDQDPAPAESVRGGSRSYDIGAFEAMVEMGGIIPPMEGTAWEIE